MNKVIWIGMARVVPDSRHSNILNGAKYAYVNIVAYASSDDEFKQSVKDALANLGFILEKLEDVELFEMLTARAQPALSIFFLVEQLKLDKKLQFGTFHVLKP